MRWPRILSALFLSSVILLTLIAPAAVSSQTKEELEAELKKIEAQIVQYEKDLTKTKTDKQTLTNKISQLKKEQEKIALQIKATNLQIGELGKQLTVAGKSIKETEQKLEQLKEQAGGILRIIYEEDHKSLVEIFLGTSEFSEFFAEVQSLEQLSLNLAFTMDGVKEVKSELQIQRADLESKQGAKKNLLSIQTLQKQNLQTSSNEKNQLLKETQGKEVRYQTIIADSKKKAQEIRSRIYELLGVSKQITFGEAVEIAQWVSKQTGVRPAFLLAVLTQESNLGKNVGTCNRLSDPPSKSWKVVMKPERDQAPFLATTKELGLDPDITPVSCPMRDANGNRIGWGGAMGPAQFIPSTWVLYKNRVSALTGKNPANPWDIRDAFAAAALLMKDNGAARGGNNAEWTAAMLYFSGSTNPQFRFYGDSVIALAERYEEDIRALA